MEHQQLRSEFEVRITQSARDKLFAVMEEHNVTNVALRLYVGLQGFGMALDSNFTESDKFVDYRFDSDGVVLTVVTDDLSSDLIDGAVVDWQDAAESSGFTITNPNMEQPPSLGGCGTCSGGAGCC